MSISNAPTNGSAIMFDNSTGYFDITSGASFTVEWFQYMTETGGANPRAFAIGTYSAGLVLGFSEEGDDATTRVQYLWSPGAQNLGSVNSASVLLNKWVHFAIVGNGTTIQVYRDGAKIGSTYPYTSFTSTTNLAIGNETTNSKASTLNGYITNFRWVVGTAVYTDTFTRPSAPLKAISGTRLLLLAANSSSVTTDSSTGTKTATVNGTVSWVPNSPFA